MIILSCVVFFIIIPVIIYVTCYFTFQTVHGEVKNFEDFFEITGDMFHFHSTLEATHPFSSEWYTWPITYKPVWFYMSRLEDMSISTICNIGNPIIWWFGTIAMVFNLVMTVIKRKKENIFILIMFLAVWMPFIWIGRVMFLYHYFPALVYIMLAITYIMKFICEKTKTNCIMYVYMIIVLMFFIVFYPVVSGTPISADYKQALQWFETWIF